jgi:filamentous hemagglutinin family protein
MSSISVRRTIILAAITQGTGALWTAPLAVAGGVLPQGGQYVSGQGSISGHGNGLLVTQPGSTRGVIDWRSFSIGNGSAVTFDNGSGATLNRVTGGSPSAILGKLSATGSLYVINPQGVVVGPKGAVSTAGRFVASTLDVPDAAFMQGGTLGALTLSGDSKASVVNLGKISSSGGDVFLIAREAVANLGTVDAPNGTAEFAAGRQVLLLDSSTSRQVFVQAGSRGTVIESGSTRAAQINLQAADGNIYALAGGGERIRATGTATRDGHVWLVADGGRVSQSGSIAATDAGGQGGTVDTTADKLAFANGASVHAGQWNIATPGFTIDRTAAGAFVRSLNAGTSVGVTATGANGGSGDLMVASKLGWRGPAALTLSAYRDLTIARNATLKNTGSGNLSLRADATGIDNGGSVTNQGTIDWSASAGIVSALYDMNGSYAPGTILSNTAWTAMPDSGLVTQVTGYKLVNSVADLQNVSLDLAGVYALGQNIDASTAQAYVPIGSGATPFAGQFDGMGHAITALTYSQSVVIAPGEFGGTATGLFGVIGSAGVVRDVSVAGGIGGPGVYGAYGLLAGVNNGTIAGASSSGGVSLVGGSSYNSTSGGLVGWNYGTITRSSSAADVGSEGNLGGLVGINYDSGVIRQSFATGAVNAQAHSGGGGGLAGSNSGLITQSYATGAVNFQPDYCGGFGTACTSNGGALVRLNQGTIEQSFATGPVTQMYGPAGGPLGAGIANTNSGTIAGDVVWNAQTTGIATGVVSGTGISAANGLTTAQMSTPSSFGPTYDFGANGVWAMPAGATHPVLRWQVAH